MDIVILPRISQTNQFDKPIFMSFGGPKKEGFPMYYLHVSILSSIIIGLQYVQKAL